MLTSCTLVFKNLWGDRN